MQELKNEKLTIRVNWQGAELASIKSNSTGKEYIWQADPSFWNRHSPVLFPFVGRLWDDKYRYNGTEYKMSQHGFARDKRFTLTQKKDSEVYFELTSTPETLKVYPFHFALTIGYKISGNKVEVIWKVRNNGFEVMPFQIGAHPAFNYIDFEESDDLKGYFAFDIKSDLLSSIIKDKGCVSNDKETISLDSEGLLAINNHTFDKDALVLENEQVRKVVLMSKDKKPYIALHFNAPLVGLWSPPSKNAPFVCIEPWYGRCDSIAYEGKIEDRAWTRLLEPGDIFETSYTIEINE